MNIFQRWKQTALHNKALVLTGAIVAVGTLVYTGAAISQYCLMKQTAKEQYNLMKQTAKEQYNLMKQTAKENSDQIEKIIAEARDIAATGKESLEQSKRALDSGIEISRKDQRAWVGMMEINPKWKNTDGKPLFIKEGARYHVGVTIVNSGRTPALKVRARMRLMSFPDNKFVTDYDNVKEGVSVGVLPPQGKFTLTSPPSYKIFNASDVTSLKNGSKILYLYGEIEYEDIFRIPHRTTYCSFLAPTLDAFLVHSVYNDAN
jgi:hypothetical protein